MKQGFQNFKKNIAVNLNKENESIKSNTRGKIIVLSGISGSGKTKVANILVSKYNFLLLDKYVTRPL